MSAFQIIVVIWLLLLTVGLAVLFRLWQVLTTNVERVETLSNQVKHLYVKSTFEAAGEAEQADAVTQRGAYKQVKKFKARGGKRG